MTDQRKQMRESVQRRMRDLAVDVDAALKSDKPDDWEVVADYAQLIANMAGELRTDETRDDVEDHLAMMFDALQKE
jgi:hypothetical protein